MDKRRVIFIIIIVAAFLLIFNPFSRRRATDGTVVPPRVEREELEAAVTFLRDNHRAPEQYLADAFRDHTIVFLGEFPKIRRNPLLVQAAIPVLYEHGVRHMGIEYGLHENQARVDRLITAPEYDEAVARELLFEWVPLWGYQEYADVYRAAWRFNRDLPDGAQPFRIVALNVRQNWEHIQQEDDLQNPEVVRKVLANGIPDAYMAEVITKEFIHKGHKALVYCSMQRAITDYRHWEYEQNAREQGLDETRRMGNIVHERIGSKAMTVFIHAPWPAPEKDTQLAYPVGGIIDHGMRQLPKETRRSGFDVASSPFGETTITETVYAEGYDDLRFADLVDGYITLGMFGSYQAVSPIPEFINESNVEEAIENFPGPKDPGMDVRTLNNIIKNDTENIERVVRQFN